MKKFMTEFKEFASKGNVIDLAVGVVIGGAFGSITASLVADIISPIIGLFIGGIDIASWAINVPNFIYGGDPIVIGIGNLIMTIINFIIIAFVLFSVIKAVNAMKRKEEPAPEEPVPEAEPEPTKEEILLAEIRDILKDK